RILDQARTYLAELPPSTSGRGDAAARHLVRDFGLTADEARPLLADFNLRCQPRWDDDELERRLEEADDYDGPRGTALVTLANCDPARAALSMTAIVRFLFAVTDSWPKRVGPVLFVRGADYEPVELKGEADLFGWIHGQFGFGRV